MTQEHLLHLRLRFACKRLLAKFRLNMLSWQQLCFERRNSQLTCRPLGFGSLNLPWCHSLAIVILSHLNTLLHPSPWSMTFAAQNLEALESHKAEAATLRKRLQEHHTQFICEPMGGQSMPINGARGQICLPGECFTSWAGDGLYFQPCLAFSNSREDSSKSKGAGPEESGKLS